MNTSYPPPSEFVSEPVNELFDMLASEEARHVIQYFQQTSQLATDLDSLVEYSVEIADDTADRTSRAITIHHITLPKLAEIGLLDYDNRHNMIRYHGWPVAEQLVDQTSELDVT